VKYPLVKMCLDSVVLRHEAQGISLAGAEFSRLATVWRLWFCRECGATGARRLK
jgi:hypothetical protein